MKKNPLLFNRINTEERRQQVFSSDEKRITLSFYRYHQIEDVPAFRDQLYQLLDNLGVYGRIYLASEGINGQISVSEANFETFREKLYSIDWLRNVRLNVAIDDDGKSFYVLKIKVRPKIVADGLNDAAFDVTRRGRHLQAREVNELMEQDETLVVDMRNHYESEVGYFEGAIRPDVETFREALPIVEDMLQQQKEKPIIMYCTGGIRCEKASAYYLHKGFKNVYMIDGGIIEYSRQCEQQQLPNRFRGKNFVFDERLGERISAEVVSRCYQCGTPCDDHTNCNNDGCHALIIQCPECAEAYQQCCSRKCAEFMQLPADVRQQYKNHITFMGKQAGKGRYYPELRDEALHMPELEEQE